MGGRTHVETDFHSLTSGKTGSHSYFLSRSKQLGFDFCATGIRLPLPVSNPATILVNNYPEPWQKLYVEKGYLAVDPVIPAALATPQPVLWSDTWSHSADFWEDAHGHQIAHGLSIATKHKSGALGMLSFARHTGAITTAEIELITPDLIRLAEVLTCSELADTVKLKLPELEAGLNEREREILRWTADGKTSEEIGIILAISAATVNYHVNKILEKLNAVNKTQAVVKAIICKLL